MKDPCRDKYIKIISFLQLNLGIGEGKDVDYIIHFYHCLARLKFCNHASVHVYAVNQATS